MATDDDRDGSDPAFWSERYQKGRPPWDLGRAPPVLQDFVDSHDARQRVLVPGAGFGHDAVAWAVAGHDVVAVDFAPEAVEGARHLAAERSVTLEVMQADVFDLPDSLDGTFDIVWEQTCLCAIDPNRRRDYARSMAAVLRPEGQLIALLWNCGAAGGPPFDLTPEVVRALLEPAFIIRLVERIPDEASLRSNEFLVLAEKRAEQIKA